MSEGLLERAVLLADVTGSTALYEALGDVEGARRIGACVEGMGGIVAAFGGRFVGAKGDDVLASFTEADAALAAVQAIMAGCPGSGLAIHAGLHFGRVVSTRNDIFGDAVNLTARLAGAANAGEVLISGEFASRLAPAAAAHLRRLNPMIFKGKLLPVDLFSLGQDTMLFDGAPAPGRAPTEASVVLRFGDRRLPLSQAGRLSIGRSPENDLVLDKPFVSRRHATIAISGGRVQLTDHSSYGSYFAIGGAAEFVARRETILLVGSGRLSPGISATDGDAAVIGFEVTVRG